MSVSSGSRLGHYTVLAPLGRGGMGEVYSAKDARLGREVAIKILPQDVSQDAERLARFEREARLLAALNHPNIAAIYGSEREGDVSFLVLELVPGETLADIVARGALDVESCLPMFSQIADALAAAHEKGIVHRDLKPSNIQVTPEGKVKVLDFGLAKALSPEPESSEDFSHSPTATRGATERGVVLGTASYMSPEQARGKALDKRTDIWSFGCVLYEALTGRKAFEGETVADVLAAIVKEEPRWERLPSTTPARVFELLKRCLVKDRNQRLRDMGDARWDLEQALRSPSPIRPRRPWLAAVAALALTSALFLAVASFFRAERESEVIRLEISLPGEDRLQWTNSPMTALSPDGGSVVYAAIHEGKEQLFRRFLDRFEAEPLRGTEGAAIPFFSPDGRSLGFWSDGNLKKLSLESGIVSTLSPGTFAVNAVWTAGDEIVFSDYQSLSRVPGAGGSPVLALTMKDMGVAASGNVFSALSGGLPGGDHVLVTVLERGKARVVACRLSTKRCLVVVEDAISGQYAPPGFLVYAHLDGTLMGVPFDAKRLAVEGMAVPLGQDVILDEVATLAFFSVSDRGSLVYVSGREQVYQNSLVWVDRSGKVQTALSDRRPFGSPVLSPDASRLTVTTTGGVWRVWVGDLSRDTLTLFDPSPHESYASTWTPDGRRLTFVSDREGEYQIFSQPADGGAPPERLFPTDYNQNNPRWSRDGKLLVYSERHPDTGNDVMLVRMDKDKKPTAFVHTPADEGVSGRGFSPDGRVLAYWSSESGQAETYLKEIAENGERVQVSSGGSSPMAWSPNGRELFYGNPGGALMAVPIQTSPKLQVGKPYVVFQSAPFDAGRGFDVAADGRFLGVEPGIYRERPPLRVVLNWPQELSEKAPVSK